MTRGSQRSRHLRSVVAGAACSAFAACTVISPQALPTPSTLAPPKYDAVALGGFRNEGALQDIMRQAVIEMGIARTIDAAAPIRIVGNRFDVTSNTSAGTLAWNVLNSALLLFMFGGPYLGNTHATAEIQLFEDGRLQKTYGGTGEASWRVHYEIIPRILDARNRARTQAKHLALWKALESLARDRREGNGSPP